MAIYIKPQALVYQEFRAVPASITDPLRAHISGGHAKLNRYAVAAEKTQIDLGAYNPASDTAYAWPEKTAGSLVDQSYAKVFIDDAKLLFFRDLIGQGSTIAPVSGYKNRIRSTSVAFKDNGDYPRDEDLLRDVKVGDSVYVRGSDGGDTFDLTTYVRGFAGEAVASSRGAATAADSNKSGQGLTSSIDKVSGADNNIVLTADVSGYNGLATGDIDETYTIEVVSGSIDSDMTTARLRITSASGNDNVSSKAPAAEGGFTAIGTRGLLVEFGINPSASGSSAAGVDEVAPNDFVPGQKWKVRVVQAFTAPTPTSSGTYTGTEDTTYIVECVTGGGYGDSPKVQVSTTTGVDVSGPTVVPDSATAVVVGSNGVRIAFDSGTGLCKGDKWYIEVTAAAEGAMQTLILGHNLPDDLLDNSDLDLELSIKKNIQVTQNRIGFAPIQNWTTSDTEITLASGLIAYDSSWVDEDGEQVALDVTGGTVYAEYREWLPDFVGIVESMSDAGDVEAVFGTTHPDNPLAYGVLKALSNSNGTSVRFTAVADPSDVDSWAEVVDVLGGRDDVYNCTPMTHDRAVQDLFAAHVGSSSSAESGRWRGAFFNLQARPTAAVVDDTLSSDEDVVLARLQDDPDTSGTQYTYLQITSGNAELEDLGVKAGDIVRFLYTTDGFGSEEYTSFTIDEVLNETSVRLATGHTVAVSTPQKVEIWRNLKKSEIAAEIGERAGSFGSSRVCVVWPDTLGAGGLDVPGYYLCAALAGLRSGVAPHQGLTNVEIAGFDDVFRSTDFFNNNHLDTLAGSGVWVVTQAQTGPIFTRHAVTSDPTDISHREEVVRANVDSMSYVFLRGLLPFIGRANVTPSALNVIRVQVEAVIEFLRTSGFTETLGGQLIDAAITELRQHALLKDRVVLALDLQIPYPMNNIELHLVI